MNARPRKNRRLRGFARKAVLTVGVILALSLGLIESALATYPPYIDLTTAGAVQVDGAGAVYIQGGTGAGTGTFDPFLTLSSNADTEKGYDTTATSGQFDSFFGGGRTHPIQAAAIPPITYTPPGGSPTVYREFSLDANDQGSDDYMSLDSIKIFLDDQNDLTGFNKAADTFSSDNSNKATKIYDMGDGVHVLMRSQALTPGSGVSDITVLIPDTLFPANCYYGSLTCNRWVYFYNEAGFLGTATADGITANWNVTAGFEEWRTRLLPVANVTKTAVASATRTFDWTLTKQVSIDGGATWQDADSVDLFNGQSQSYEWRLSWTKSAGVLSNAQVSGTIAITNPTGGSVISSSIDAVINSVADTLTLGATTTHPAVNCGVTFPYTLHAGATLNCTYTATGVNTDNGTNVATVALDNGAAPDVAYSSAPVSIDWANATINEVDETASIDDPNFPGANQSNLSTSGSFTSTSQTFTCGNTTTLTNTATLTEVDSHQTRTDSASLTVNCYGLTVSKTANTSFTRTYDWTLQKDVSVDGGATWQDAATVNLFNGQSQTYQWKLTWTKNAGTDSDWLVQGSITVTNPAPIAATGVSVTDALSVFGGVSVNCPSTSIAANSSMICTYSQALGAATNQTNTATATLAGHTYTGTAAVTFSSTPTTEVDATAGIGDANFPDADQSSLTTSGSFTSTAQTFTCGSTTTITNTAILAELDSDQTRTDSASLTVNCYGLTVAKTANTSLTRTYNWSIQKSSTDPHSLTLNPAETYVYPYSVTVNMTGSTDSAWAVSGSITVTNPAPIAATGVSVADLMSSSGAIAVSCPSTSIAANGSMTCTYSTSVASGASQTNTATATLAGQNYSGSAPVNFSTATVNQVDECITVTDTNVGTLGTVCVGQTLPKTYSYNVTLGGYAATDCGDHTINNTATFTTNDTSTTGTASWTVTVTVPCPTGCTLTQGYWKTHSKYGPAPFDPTWANTGTPDFHEDTMFYTSGQTYYQVMWTAPKGGNAYYILAHQYIAALLNIRAGAATTPAVDAALAYANTFFNTYTPTSTLSKTERANAIAAAGTLGSYNTGTIGPGHCSEDSISRSADTSNP